ncbi:T9SS type A sorting domain-containing protein [Pedobacter sp. BS3]|uniref:T9SS type A sorting domain-containing protein n=1 Tax=Pedobacter sp. BS3 TaxID=2567937 RepID=UPI0011EE7868|nr:T9SS type A sorting domain-containing protein [Pedobacter sp. BS3]TZF82097.1 T9SS type A sorting domain-containing protein [Pedobacter sp. BS3]
MMKKLLLTLGFACLSVYIQAQTAWNYDFANASGSLTTGSSTTNSGDASPAFLPAPGANPTSSTPQTARVRLASDGTSKFEFVNSGVTLGSGSRLLITGGTSTSKFSIYNIEGTLSGSVSFKVRFKPTTSGQWIFAYGKNNGVNNTYSGNAALPTTENEVFAGLRWVPQSDGSIKFYTRADGSTWSTNNKFTFEADVDYAIEVLCNNSSSSVNYTKNSTSYTIAANAYHVWVNGTQVEASTGNYDFAHGGLAGNTLLTDFLFYGVYSSSASTIFPQAYVDDFNYANYIEPNLLPVTLVSFTAQKQGPAAQLSWTTASEQNNLRFDIERSTDGKIFTVIGSRDGAGNSTVDQHYAYTDYQPEQGVNYYRLVQYDYNGKATVFDPKAVDFGIGGSSLKVLSSPGSSELQVSISAEKASSGKLYVYSVQGKKLVEQTALLNKGANMLTVDASGLQPGIYVIAYNGTGQVITGKFVR